MKTSLDTIIKTYKESLKEGRSEVEQLEEAAKEIVARLDAAHDAENLLEDCERGLTNVAYEKNIIKEALSEATLLDEDRVPDLKEQYRVLADEERRLQDQREQLTGVVQNNGVDPSEVAELRARFRLWDTGASILMEAVRTAVEADTASLSERVRAVEATLPEGDDLDTLRSLGFADMADSYAAEIRKDEDEHGNADWRRGALHRQVQRILARA